MQYLSFSDFLHLEGPSDLPTVLLQMTLFQTFFLWQSNLTLSVYECIKIVYPFICGCTSWLLLCLHPVNSAALNIGVHVSFSSYSSL